ncbi:MAG: helix-hairpin-helix domain-containing protein, partial [Candidatus Gracilibacteria bacterium]|nr:helix-hairpin-helix domain-containing protein [Candidatus Gracilibacteria bacterium]
EDVSYLSKIPGLGKKTAGRMILELKGKIDLIAPSVENHFPHSLQEEALEALVSLGYDKPSVIRFLNSAPESFESAEDAVRSFLQNA